METNEVFLQVLNELVKNGGEGSGDFNHAGNPPHVGGSEPVESRHARGFKSKSEKKEVKKEEKKDKSEIKDGGEKTKKRNYQEIIDKYDKKYDVDKNDKGESWYDRADIGELKTDLKDYEKMLDTAKEEKSRTEKLLKDEDYSKWHNEFKRQIADLDREIGEYKERIEYAKAHLEKKQTDKKPTQEVKEDKKVETKEEKKYPNRHAEILYKDLPELREKLHKAKYERAKQKQKGVDVSLFDKKIKELESEEQKLKDEMAKIRDNRRSSKERYTSLIEQMKANNSLYKHEYIEY